VPRKVSEPCTVPALEAEPKPWSLEQFRIPFFFLAPSRQRGRGDQALALVLCKAAAYVLCLLRKSGHPYFLLLSQAVLHGANCTPPISNITLAQNNLSRWQQVFKGEQKANRVIVMAKKRGCLERYTTGSI
jgi:hypothetical protein